MLTAVTLTGADDQVDPRELAMLSAEFPFVEWGILMSESRAGTPRYPSRDWLLHLEDLAKMCARSNDPQVRPMRLSAHFCGSVAREAIAGRLHPFPVIERVQRIQINGYAPTSPGLIRFGKAMPCYEIILQLRTDGLSLAVLDVDSIGHASILFDASGGLGLRPDAWPERPRGISVGYAGGIGPENVLDVVMDIESTMEGHVDFWIDMESGIRTENRFDLNRVRQVLEKARPFVRDEEASS